MKAIREITEWDDNTPNHSYLLNDAGKLIAYKKQSNESWEVIDTPMMFSRTRRKFKNIDIPVILGLTDV